MIVSPPFLPTGGADQTEDAWLDRAMAPAASRLPDTRAPEGSFPLGHNLAWHNGMHIQAPQSEGETLPVRAIADGTVVFAGAPTPVSVDADHAQNYNPFDRPGVHSAAWTDNGCVILEHRTSIGAAVNVDTEVVFYSLYMHLSALGQITPHGATAQRRLQTGDVVWRKDEVGSPGQIYGHGGQVHCEMCLDAANLRQLIGRPPNWVEPAVAPASPPPPVADGRIDSIFGSLYFYLAADTPTDTSEPASHLRRTISPSMLGGEMWVKMTYSEGNCTFESYDTRGTLIGRLLPDADAEYNLYEEATRRHGSLPVADRAASSPSGWYELLRFGRNIGPGLAVTDKDPLPANAAHWRRIPVTGGNAVWADLNAAGSYKFSDADFLPVMGWNCIDDDSNPNDQRCDSARLKRLICDPDTSNERRMETTELAARLGNSDVMGKLKRTICKFPSEWDRDTASVRYAFAEQLMQVAEDPTAWPRLQAHLQALSFSGLPAAYLAANWRLHPRETIGLMRKCGWLSHRELLQLVPQHIIRKPGSHNAPGQGHWESPNIGAASGFLRQHSVALNRAMQKFGVVSPIRQACFFGNAVQETAWFRLLREAAGAQPNLHLGWYGRGFLQLTNPNGNINGGNNNYYKYFRFLGRSPAVPPGPQEKTWRDQVGLDSHHAAHSTGAYWVWPDKSVPTPQNPLRPQVDSASRYADVPATNQRRVIQTANGAKVWYYNQSFTNCAAAVNYPSTVGQNPPNMNGLVDRSTAFVNALMVLTDVPLFEGLQGQVRSTPENFVRRIVP